MPNINKEVSIGYKKVDRQVDFIFPFDNPASPAEFDANTAELQRAIDFAEEKGTKLVFDRETYTFSHSIFLGTDAWIDFNGATIIYMPQTASTITSFISNKSYLETDRANWDHNIHIENGRFDTDRDKGNVVGFSHAFDIRIDNLTGLENIRYHLIDLAGVEDVRVENCETYCTQSVPYQVDNLNVAGGLAVELPDHTASQSTVDGTTSKRIYFENNLADGGPTGNNSHAFHLHRDGGEDIHIIRNHVKNFKDGVRQDANTNWTGVYIRDNIFDLADVGIGNRHGIYFQGLTNDLTITGNRWTSPVSFGILLRQSLSNPTERTTKLFIDDNYFLDVEVQAFVIEYFQNYTISNNVVDNCSTGFDTTLADQNNTYRNDVYTCFYIRDSWNGVITMNSFIKVNCTWITYFNNCDQLLVDGNNVTDFANLAYIHTGANNFHMRNNNFVPVSGYAYYYVQAFNTFAFRAFDNTLARANYRGFYFESSNNIFIGDNITSGTAAESLFHFKDTVNVAFTSKNNNFNTDNYVTLEGACSNYTGYVDVWNYWKPGVWGDRQLAGGTFTDINFFAPTVSTIHWLGLTNATAMTSGAWNTIPWDGQQLNGSNCMALNTGIYTVRVSGYYRIRFKVLMVGGTIVTGQKYTLAITRTGSAGVTKESSRDFVVSDGAQWVNWEMDDIIRFDAQDTFTCDIRHFSGVTPSVYGNKDDSNVHVHMVQMVK